MAKIAQLIEGNYNILDNIPVINQDLTASGFTPVANTYYRHTGATTDTFTQGVIYLYDTTYHKLGESGGTTFNKYTTTITTASSTLLKRIKNTAKGTIFATVEITIGGEQSQAFPLSFGDDTIVTCVGYTTSYYYTVWINLPSGFYVLEQKICKKDGTIQSLSFASFKRYVVTYYNDAEIK